MNREQKEITEFLETLRKGKGRRISNDSHKKINEKYGVFLDSTELELPSEILAKVIMGRR